MNSKEIKEIAGIIKKEIVEANEKLDVDSDKYEQVIFDHSLIAERLADYFEREDLERIARVCYEGEIGSKLPLFNRKQFLKLAGVEE